MARLKQDGRWRQVAEELGKLKHLKPRAGEITPALSFVVCDPERKEDLLCFVGMQGEVYWWRMFGDARRERILFEDVLDLMGPDGQQELLFHLNLF